MRLIFLAIILVSAQGAFGGPCDDAVRGDVIDFVGAAQQFGIDKARVDAVIGVMINVSNYGKYEIENILELNEFSVVTMLKIFEENKADLTRYFDLYGEKRFGLNKPYREIARNFRSSRAMRRLRQLADHFELVHARLQLESLRKIPRDADTLSELDKLVERVSALRMRMETRGEPNASNFLNNLETFLDETQSDDPGIRARLERLKIICVRLQWRGLSLRSVGGGANSF